MNPARRNRGSVAVPTAVMVVALTGMAALGVDVAFLLEAKGELRRTADAAALAGVSGLLLSQDEAVIRARDYAAKNEVLGEPISPQALGLTFGQWDFDTNQFSAGSQPFNCLRVDIQLTENSNPAAPGLMFAKIFDLQKGFVSASATAALGKRDIMIVLDRSGSMDDDGGNPPQPITATKAAAKRFVDKIAAAPVTGDQMGLVWYSDRATLDQRLTTNFSQVKTRIDVPNANGCTNIAEAAQRAHQELTSGQANPRSVPIVVLLSDGKTNTRINGTGCQYNSPGQFGTWNPAEVQARDQAVAMAGDGIVLYTISLGNDTNPTLMEAMAEATGGQHFYAPTTAQLDGIFTEISNRVPTMLVE